MTLPALKGKPAQIGAILTLLFVTIFVVVYNNQNQNQVEETTAEVLMSGAKQNLHNDDDSLSSPLPEENGSSYLINLR